MRTMIDHKPFVLLCGVFLAGLFLCAIGARATSIQLSPDVGRRGIGHYRSPSYFRSLDQYENAEESPYNIALGSLRLALTGTIDARWTDNVDRVDDDFDKDSAWTIVPGIQANVNWPLTPYLIINSGINVQYEYWTDDHDNRFLVSGTDGAFNSNFDIDFLVGQTGRITLTEEFSRDVDTIGVLAVGEDSSDVVWTRNIVSLLYQTYFTPMFNGKFRLTHSNQWVDDDDYKDREFYRDSADVVFLWQANPVIQIGPYGTVAKSTYPDDEHNEPVEWQVGLSAVYQRSEALVVTGSVGYQTLEYDNDNVETATDDYDSWTASLAARFTTSEFVVHRISGSYGATHSQVAGLHNYSEDLQADYTISVELLEDIVVNGEFTWLRINESDGGEEADFFIAGIGMGYRLTEQTTIDGHFRRAWKVSHEDDGSEYVQHTIEFGLTHRF